MKIIFFLFQQALNALLKRYNAYDFQSTLLLYIKSTVKYVFHYRSEEMHSVTNSITQCQHNRK